MACMWRFIKDRYKLLLAVGAGPNDTRLSSRVPGARRKMWKYEEIPSTVRDLSCGEILPVWLPHYSHYLSLLQKHWEEYNAVFCLLVLNTGREVAKWAGPSEGKSQSHVWNAERAQTWTKPTWRCGAAAGLCVRETFSFKLETWESRNYFGSCPLPKQQLYSVCRSMQTRVVELIPQLLDEGFVEELLVVNDDLNNAFIRYERCAAA